MALIGQIQLSLKLRILNCELIDAIGFGKPEQEIKLIVGKLQTAYIEEEKAFLDNSHNSRESKDQPPQSFREVFVKDFIRHIYGLVIYCGKFSPLGPLGNLRAAINNYRVVGIWKEEMRSAIYNADLNQVKALISKAEQVVNFINGVADKPGTPIRKGLFFAPIPGVEAILNISGSERSAHGLLSLALVAYLRIVNKQSKVSNDLLEIIGIFHQKGLKAADCDLLVQCLNNNSSNDVFEISEYRKNIKVLREAAIKLIEVLAKHDAGSLCNRRYGQHHDILMVFFLSANEYSEREERRIQKIYSALIMAQQLMELHLQCRQVPAERDKERFFNFTIKLLNQYLILQKQEERYDRQLTVIPCQQYCERLEKAIQCWGMPQFPRTFVNTLDPSLQTWLQNLIKKHQPKIEETILAVFPALFSRPLLSIIASYTVGIVEDTPPRENAPSLTAH